MMKEITKPVINQISNLSGRNSGSSCRKKDSGGRCFSIRWLLVVFIQVLISSSLLIAQQAATNPFNLVDTGRDAVPAFGDLDNDGDLDLLVGDFNGQFTYFENEGTATNPSFGTAVTNAFSLDVGVGSKPTLADLDGDGDLDLLSGRSQFPGNAFYYENIGTSTSPNFGSVSVDPFGISQFSTSSHPRFVDLDNDGDYDLLVAILGGVNIGYLENIGTATNPSFDTPQLDPFGLANEDGKSYITTIDIDNDGDFDIILGDDNGNLELIENIGDANNPSFVTASYNPFGNGDVGDDAALTAGDLNNDGDTDLLVGNADGDLVYFEVNISSLPSNFLASVQNPFGLDDITGSVDGSTPVFVDLDNDNDLDILSGIVLGDYFYYENTGTATSPSYAAAITNPFGLAENGFSPVPTFADLDNDGDLDLLSGENSGNFIYFENTGTASNPAFATAVSNPFNLTKLNLRSSPFFVDLDNDGDYDVLAGNSSSGEITYFENTGTISNPTYASPQVNVFGMEVNGFTSAIITMSDVDDDSDFDLIIGSFGDQYLYAENVGTVNNPDFAFARSFLDTPFGRVPSTIADIDDDGDQDILVGSLDGDYYYFQNTTFFDNSPPVFTFTGTGTLPGVGIAENTVGVILDIEANDGNGGATDMGITYSLSGVDAALFSIESSTGALSFLSPPDFENPLDNGEDNFYNITVTIDDGFPMDNTASENFFIIVSNVSEPITWQGLTDEWLAASNWSPANVPQEEDDVVIPATANDPVISTSGIAINDLVVEDQVTLTISSGAGLLINGSATFNGSGQVSVSRNVEDDLGFSIVGVPLEDQTVGDLGADVVYFFNGFSNAFTTLPASLDIFPSTGYFVAFDSPDASITLTGVPRIDQSVRQIFNNDNPADDSNEGYNLVANPFISGLDRSAFVSGNSAAVTGTIWYWNDGGGNSNGLRTGDYVAVTNAGVTSSDPAINITPSSPIGLMQGFFVRSAAPQGQTSQVLFARSMQTAASGTDADFFRGEESSTENVHIKLSLAGLGELSGLYNDLIITFRDDATYGPDFGLDAEKFSGNENISFYSLQDHEKYAIQALPLEELNVTEVQLGYYLKNVGDYQLQVESLVSQQQYIIQLVDRETNTLYDLTQSTSIPIKTTSEITSDRFLLQVSPRTVTSIPGQLLPDFELVGGSTSHLTVKNQAGDQRMQVFSISGQLLYDRQVQFNDGLTTVQLSLVHDQVYVLRIGEKEVKFRLN